MTRTGPADEPGSRIVDIWMAPLDVPQPDFAELAASLSGPERARAARFRFPCHARRFSGGRGWLRHVLGAELGVPPGEVRLTDDGTKPRLSEGTGPHFNLSHACELAVIAVSSGAVGIDVEAIDPVPYDHGLAGLACSAAEAEALGRLPAGDQALAFLRVWTAKEAYLKATGAGLSVDPSSLHVGTLRGDEGTPVQVAAEPGGGRWWVRELQPAHGYIGAVAAEGRAWQVCLRSTAELALGAPA